MNLKDTLSYAAIAVAAVGFYCVGRYHESYMEEKRNAKAEAEAKVAGDTNEATE